ncbi:uncharacterized protein HGUI_00437 [Hanseniaspora guilliermondii]|uniref:COMPASS component BRE2 n=1 Tax=Hanseniaspora guilliermondii TaxID=56406 RepID=A0A1L0CHK1_9ASCO|nr:uncharacterized protein HGUI_00437 [Hanseniaspora guilliermondii]
MEKSVSVESSSITNDYDNIPMNKRHFKYDLCKCIGNEEVLTTDYINDVHLSPFDRPLNIVIDPFTLKSIKNELEKGWASCRANTPIREGLTYFEYHIKNIDFANNQHTRLGLSQRTFPLSQPVGSDLFNSVGIRDMTFERLYNRKKDIFVSKDIVIEKDDHIGVLISLPSMKEHCETIKKIIENKIEYETDEFELFHLRRYLDDLSEYKIHKERVSIKYKNEYFYESQDYVSIGKESSEDLLDLNNSFVKIFKNGEYVGDLSNEENCYLKSFLPPFVEINYETNRFRPLFYKLLKQNDTKNIETLVARKYYDDGSLGYYPTISLFNESCVELIGGMDELKYYKEVMNYVQQSDDIKNKELKDLNHRYQELQKQTALYDEEDLQIKRSLNSNEQIAPVENLTSEMTPDNVMDVE